MPTIAHGPSQVLGRASHRLTMWIVGAVLVAAVVTVLALSLTGSDAAQTAPSADAPQAAPHHATQWGGARP